MEASTTTLVSQATTSPNLPKEAILEEIATDPVPEQVAPVMFAAPPEASKEQLMADRRALATVAYDQDPDLTPEVREAIKNPSGELLAVLVAEYLAGNISMEEIETEYAIVDDWLEEPLFAYIQEQGPLQVAGLGAKPLPEPNLYRTSEAVSTQSEVIRYAIAASKDGPLSVYAIAGDGAFSGVVQINEDMHVPYQQIKNVEPSSFVGDYGLYIDSGAPEEFNIMLAGNAHGVGTLFYTLHQEGKNVSFTLPMITTPEMVASATWVNQADGTELYKWRIDYDGDGEVDFLLSHHDVLPKKEAEAMINFIVKSLPPGDKNIIFYETNREFLIEALMDEELRNRS
jgi:hypothetical protein